MLDQQTPFVAAGKDTPVKRANRSLLIGLIVICVCIEAVLQLADLGLIGPARLRALSYEYAGFWPGLLRNWTPNYAFQPQTMFFSYGFLHSGLLHLIINMVTLWSLGIEVLRRVGNRGFMMLYIMSILGGAAGFALLASELRPMIGASGALFGLAGGLLAWHYVDRYSAQQKLLPVVQGVVLLILLNVVLWWAMQGQLAWETHLGGFVAGWVMALLIDPRPRVK